MRKVKNNISVSDPAVMFARGVVSLINDPLHRPAQCDSHDDSSMRRRAGKQDARGNLFNVLMRQFANL
jgi:hypothetical protein